MKSRPDVEHPHARRGKTLAERRERRRVTRRIRVEVVGVGKEDDERIGAATARLGGKALGDRGGRERAFAIGRDQRGPLPPLVFETRARGKVAREP